MRIFLSYASEDQEEAKGIYLVLRDQGHKIFFDRADLPPGEEYHNRIRSAIERSHLFLFLVTPYALDAGSYTLNELAMAERAGTKLLPVVLRKPDMAFLPASIKSVTFLEPAGNPAAAVAAEVHGIARDRRRRLWMYATAAGAFLMVTSALFFTRLQSSLVENHPAGKKSASSIAIPAGTFIMGDDEESPRREIFLDAFTIDKFEVTVGQYAKFLQATGNVKLPVEWDTVNPETDAQLPVVGVDWQDAESFCRWADKRLPTEAEWEKAARGGDERKYPWGNDTPAQEQARFARSSQSPVYKNGVAPVGSHAKGMSPHGVYDLAGNVSEWVADWFSERFPRGAVRNPKGPDSGDGKVLRGGGWFDPPERITTTKRFHANPDHRADDIGFRCAGDIK